MFRTKVNPKISAQKIAHSQSIVAMGSCFAQHIGQKLIDYKFNVDVNPFGTLFNPISMFKLIQKAADGVPLDANRIVHTQGVCHHYDLHSDLSALEESELLQKANTRLKQLGAKLPETSELIYTLGTAIVYQLRETSEIVANCHKIPARDFDRRFLDIEEIVNAFDDHYTLIKSINKNARFILTVSPVRHQKESFEQNNVSKSILRIACEQCAGKYGDVEYFPAFEIMMDELRDYRFYAEDMLHPNSVATDYIWQQFAEVYFSDQLKTFMVKWEKIRKALAHRPYYAASQQHQSFINKTIERLMEFKGQIDISTELEYLKAQLI